MKLIPGLLLTLVLLFGYGVFATVKWASAGARCGERLAEQRSADAEVAADQQRRALAVAAGIHADERARLRGEQTAAAGSTHTRETVIREVRVTGACVMPAGLPSLGPAVEEARAAARD